MDIEEKLECPVCLELSVSPIHVCKNGHILCGLCIDTVKKCALCEEENMFPCYFAERLVKEYDLKSTCRYVDSGCDEVITMDQMKTHLSICEYRPIKCFESPDECQKFCSITEFSQHLIDHHQAFQTTLISGVSTLTYRLSSVQKVRREYRIYYVNLLRYDGREFLIHAEFNKGTFFWWITILGGQKDANQFKYKTSIKDSFNFWKLPVLPIRQNKMLSEVLETGKFANIHWKTLLPFIGIDNDYDDNKHVFQIEVKMIRVLPALNSELMDETF